MKRVFTIKELESFSGIKAHTIRTWEKRYNLLFPIRHGNNIRSYTIDEMALLLDIGLLTTFGFKISKLQGYEVPELAVRIATLKSNEARKLNSINKLVKHMFMKDMDGFDETLDEAMLSWGLDNTISEIILPFLERVQVMSYVDGSPEVHFIVTSVRRKFILAFERLKPVPDNAKTALLFLPENEHFDLILIYLCYQLKKKGIKTLYLGTNVPIGCLASVVNDNNPDFIYSYIADKQKFPFAEYHHLFAGLFKSLHASYASNDYSLEKAKYTNIQFFDYKQLEVTI